MVNKLYEEDQEFIERYPDPAYRVAGYGGIAFYALGWEVKEDEDTEWSGIMNRTGNIIMVMVGDDYHHSVEPSDIFPLKRHEYCGTCGQIGCKHNLYDEG